MSLFQTLRPSGEKTIGHSKVMTKMVSLPCCEMKVHRRGHNLCGARPARRQDPRRRFACTGNAASGTTGSEEHRFRTWNVLRDSRDAHARWASTPKDRLRTRNPRVPVASRFGSATVGEASSGFPSPLVVRFLVDSWLRSFRDVLAVADTTRYGWFWGASCGVREGAARGGLLG